jgi:GT2 family glycosyltransferase
MVFLEFNMLDLSILIVHYNTPGLLRQTLKGIRSSAPVLNYEVIVIDNNARMRVEEMIKNEFPDVKVVVSEKNLGFGKGMNLAMKKAKGRHVFIGNPDICLFPGVFEKLVAFLDEHKDVGMVGPQLLNPDGTVQDSCYRFMKPEVIMYRRVPFIGKLSSAKKVVDDYLMKEVDHNKTMDVDYLLGAAILIRAEALEQVGVFDPEYFMYFEDQDLCRRFWKAGWRVVYHPDAKLVHYHRRETAQGGFLSQLTNPLTRIQIKSALYYYKKYKGDINPRTQEV